MAHYSVRKKIRRRKVANLAAISRQRSVNNMCIHIVEGKSEKIVDESTGKEYVVGKVLKWKKEKHPQPKRLKHSYKGWKWMQTFTKEHGWNWEKVYLKVKSEYPQYKSFKFTREDLIEGYIKAKQEKWDRKHPCPAPTDDLFKDEYIPVWKEEQEKAHLAIAQQVRAKYGNDIRLLGRYEIKDQQYTDYKELTKVPDKLGEVTEQHDINSLDPNKSKLIKTATKLTNAEKKRNPRLVATNLKDYKSGKGRIVLPKAA